MSERKPPLPDRPREREDEAPLLGSWRNLYVLEFVNLGLLVLFFYLLSKAFE